MTPEQKAKKNERQRERYQALSPEDSEKAAERARIHRANPKVKERKADRARTWYQTLSPEAKAQQNERNRARAARPEVKAKRAEYSRIHNALPEVKARKNELQRARYATAEGRAIHTEGRRRYKYNLRAGEYNAMADGQGGRCAICRCAPTDRQLSIDHDHRTDEIRGLLCDPCNRQGIGGGRDTVSYHRAAIRYLQHPPAHAALAAVTWASAAATAQDEEAAA